MKRVLITIAAAAAVGLAAGGVYAHERGEGCHAERAEHQDEKHAERHKRMAERHARHGEHRQRSADKPAASGEQPKPEEHKH